MRKFAIATALLGATVFANSAQAAITVYTTQASYLAAISNPGIDTFESLSITGLTASPITRTAGSYGYTAAAANGFFGAGSSSDHWLSTNFATDAINFSGFTGGVRGVGGQFFGSDLDGTFISVPSITLTATDASGTTTRSITNPTTTSFLGFVSTTGILTFSIASPTVDPVNGPFYFPTANNLTLGGAAVTPAVPEPASWAMIILGMGAVGGVLRRRGKVVTRISYAV